MPAAEREIVVKVSGRDWGPLWRQSPGCSGFWDNAQFVFDEELDACDYWVVCGDLMRPSRSACAAENVILLCGEPPALKKFYSGRFLAQFGAVVTCDHTLWHPGLVLSHPLLPWYAGVDYSQGGRAVQDFDDFAAMDTPPKPEGVSLVVSDKALTRAQVARLRLTERLRGELGGQLHVFGRGAAEVGDKWAALAPYKLHIAVENSRFPNYWTEKLADPFLASCLPLYWGAPNASQFFPPESLVAIDIHRPDLVVAQVMRLLAGDEWHRRLPAIREARQRVLYRYNFFAAVARICRQRPTGRRRDIVLMPEALCQGVVQRKLRSAANRLIARSGCLDRG